MKAKLLTTISLFLACLFNLNAQQYVVVDNDIDDDPREKIRLAIRAGLNFASLYDSKADDFSSDSRTGFAAGTFISIPISRYLGIQPEVVYSEKGYKGSSNLLIAQYSYTRKLGFLDIPIQLQLKPAPFLSILAGPQFSFLLHKGLDFSSGTVTVEQQTAMRNTNLRKNTLGATVGLDVILLHFVVSGRLAWDLQNNNGDGTSTSPRYKMMVAQITAGIIF